MNDDQWLKGEWRGLEKWTCAICQWDTLNGLDVARKYELTCPRCHPPIMAQQPSPVLVADKHGKIKSGG